MHSAVNRRARIAAVAVLAIWPGCTPAYVMRAAYEEARILWRRQPIATLLAEDVDPEMRARLELTLSLREFARERLGLSVGGSYTTFARVDDHQVVYVLTAAPRDRLEPYTWWFPILGRVPYRGYFDRSDAQALADRLEREGYDTYVRPSIAFSTLGWFDDPLLSPLLRMPEEELAETIVHELLHSTIYVPGQVAFNESFASFVGYRGAIAFFASRGDVERAQRAAAMWADARAFSAALGRVAALLQGAYAAGIDMAERPALFAKAQAEFETIEWRTDWYRRVSQRPLNNAVIVHDRLYNDRLDLFERAYERLGYDLPATIARIQTAVRGAPDAFAALAAAAGSGT